MHRILIPSIIAASLAASEFGVDVFAMGASYHSNRNYNWKEWNPGGGGSIWASPGYGVEGFVAMGGYKNSTGTGSFFQQVGARYVYDLNDDWIVGGFAAYGVLLGYDDKQTAPVAGASLGWRWLHLEAAYRPPTDGTEDVPGTAVVAAWLRVRVKRW